MNCNNLTNQLFEAINNDKIAIGVQYDELSRERTKVFENM